MQKSSTPVAAVASWSRPCFESLPGSSSGELATPRARSMLSPSPSWPWEFDPKHFKSPFDSKTHWCPGTGLAPSRLALERPSFARTRPASSPALDPFTAPTCVFKPPKSKNALCETSDAFGEPVPVGHGETESSSISPWCKAVEKTRRESTPPRKRVDLPAAPRL